jgi:regulator of cell morphogenesis and NO signaling
MQTILSEKTVREIALEAPLTTRVFEEFKIDFCCGGRVPFAEACEKAGVDPQTVAAKLQPIIDNTTPDDTAAERMGPTDLINHIVDTHHVFTTLEIRRLVPLAEKVASRHGENHPELSEIRDLFIELANELVVHMKKEEMHLFPYILQLDRAARANRMPPMPPFGSVANPVRVMMFEHDNAGDILRKIRSLSRDFAAPADACPSYKGLYAGLEDFERDLHRHIHLENNVLFPQAIELESASLSVPA